MPPRERTGAPRDYTLIGERSEPGFVRLPDPAADLGVRAERFAALAREDGAHMAPYLAFLARIVEAQHAAVTGLPPPEPLAEDLLDRQLRHGMPPLSRDLLTRDEGFGVTLDWLLRRAEVPDAPEAAEQARSRLLAADRSERLALAVAIFEGEYPADRLGESLYAAAALQAYLAKHAARLDASALTPVATGVCPVCGGPPVASLIVGWPRANRSRYCCCSLCGSMWNYVRVKCTVCESTGGISYYTIEGGAPDVAVETCTTCHAYVKHLRQHENPRLEPFADDVASYGLDLLVREEGFRRGGINPLFVSG